MYMYRVVCAPVLSHDTAADTQLFCSGGKIWASLGADYACEWLLGVKRRTAKANARDLY